MYQKHTQFVSIKAAEVCQHS